MSYSPSVKLANKIPHRDLYKSPFRGNNLGTNSPIPNREINGESNVNESPSWRNAYKKRCFDEFKKSRQKLINRFRNCQVEQTKPTKFKDYLEEELEKICLLEAKTDLISIDEANEIYKQIQDELIPKSFNDLNDEQIEEILKTQDIEEKLNQESILYESNKSSQIFCPVCQKEILTQENSFIYCKNVCKKICNFRIDCLETKIDLDQLKVRLEQAVKQHQCNEVPSFQFKIKDSMNKNDLILLSQLSTLPSASCFLLMSCDSCNFMQSII